MFILRNENNTRNRNKICEQNAGNVMLQQMACAVTAKTETINTF